jgi:hypothetical protein
MKNLLFIVLLILISCQPSNEELQKRYDALNIFYDYETALEKAKVVRDNQLLDFLENTTNHLRGR